MLPKEGFALDLLRSAGLKGTSRRRACARAGAAASQRRRRVEDSVATITGSRDRRGRLQLWSGRWRRRSLAAFRRCCWNRTRFPDFTNRVLARMVSAAAVTFEATVGYFGRRGFVAGNPVRPEFFTDSAVRRALGAAAGSDLWRLPGLARDQRGHGGGSGAPGGARWRDGNHASDRRTRSGTGPRWLPAGGLDARVEPFLFAMDREMKAADLVVCRAGATTLAELTAAGRASLLVPLPTAADDHQRKNAEVMRSGRSRRGDGSERSRRARDSAAHQRAARRSPIGCATMAAPPDGWRSPPPHETIVDRAIALAGR